MLAEDCREFLSFVQKRDPVVVARRDSESQEIEEVSRPWEEGALYCLWNQGILPRIEREFVARNPKPYFTLADHSLSEAPLLEFFFPSPIQEPWNGRPALTQGRVYTGINPHKGKPFEAWYAAIVRWIRKSFVRNPIPLLGGYVGAAAYEWYKSGGIFLPMFRPPLTAQWLSWAEGQDQHRAIFSK